MYENMSKLDLQKNFGDAGKCAAKFPEAGAAPARAQQHYFADVEKGSRFLLLFVISTALSLAYADAGFRTASVLLSVCGIGFSLYLRQSASYYAWLLKVAAPIDDFLANLNRMDLCPAAARWIDSVCKSGRSLYCFDLEIMAMMNESHLLGPRDAGKAFPTAS